MWIYLSVHIWACDAPKRQPWKASRSTLAGGRCRGGRGKHENILIGSHLCRLLSASFPLDFLFANNPWCCEPTCWRSVWARNWREGEFFLKRVCSRVRKKQVRKKLVRKGLRRKSRDTKMFQQDPLQTLPAAAWLFPCHKKEGWIERCTCLFWHLTSQQTRCWRKKETGCTENYIAGQWLSMDTTSRWTLVQVFSAFVQATYSYKWAKHSRIQKLDPCHVSYPPRPGQSAMILPPQTPIFKIIFSPLVFQCKIRSHLQLSVCK